MTKLEIKGATESLIFLNENIEITVKARMCSNGSTQRAYILRKEATVSTKVLEDIITTGVIDAGQERDVMTLDTPNAFLQTDIALDGDNIIMNIRGKLVDILIEICPVVYDKYVRYEGEQKILYIRMLKALWGIIVSSILYYKKSRKYIEGIGFEVNP